MFKVIDVFLFFGPPVSRVVRTPGKPGTPGISVGSSWAIPAWRVWHLKANFCTFPPKNSPNGGYEIFIMVYYDIQVSMNEKQLNKVFRQHPVKFCGHPKMRDVCDAHRTWLSRCLYIFSISCEWGFLLG